MKKTALALAAVFALASVSAVYAVDNGTEFGIEDDLTVLGTTGTWTDPDMEIKGFTLFGPTGGPQVISNAQGNVAITGNLQVNATSYFGSSVTVAGYGVFQSTVQIGGSGASTNLFFSNAAANAGQVLKARSNGFLEWAADNNTTMNFQTPYRLQMVNGADNDLADSLFLQSNAGTNITMVAASSMTILGNGTDGLGVFGATKIDGPLSVQNANTFTVGTGLSALGGALNVAGASTFVSSVTAQGNAQFGDTPGTDKVVVNMSTADGRADAALTVAGDGVTNGAFVAKFYSGANMAAWIKKK